MKPRSSIQHVTGPVWTVVILLGISLSAPSFRAAELVNPKPPDAEFERGVSEWKASSDRAERMRRAELRFFKRTLSSQQVKRLAKEIEDEDERIEFAAAAFPHVVDPENFYDVYDAFETFSKVFRLHDRLTAMRRPVPPVGGPPVISRPAPVGAEELTGILESLRKEPFDDAKMAKMRLLDRGLRGRLTCKQTAEILNLFTFDERRMECAKLSMDWISDPGQIHLLVDTMRFLSSKDVLMKFVETRRRQDFTRPAR
jgi:hypothetical protein